ncbi:MAG: SPOR domain-containing protein [Ignavibacteria bacterium]
MIKQEIIEKICKYFKLTTFEAEKIYDDIFAGIIQGVKEDNIADITNLGEFIIKYNSSDLANKKTVEFLPTLSLEEEINQRSFEEQRQFEPSKFTNPEEQVIPPVEKNILQTSTVQTITTSEKTTESPEKKEINVSEPVNYDVENSLNETSADEKHTVEDDIKKKREEILSKITTPRVESTNTVIPPVVIPPVANTVEEAKEEIIEAKYNIKEKTEEIFAKNEEISQKVTENITDINKDNKKEVEEVTEKSFSDYFTEISKEEHSFTGQIHNSSVPPPPPVVESNVKPPVENAIPPSAVELHKEITGDNSKTNEYQTTINPLPYANGNGNGNGNNFEHRLQDNSYYIWYKDSEPNTNDTQTMSYEYELLYQATKEAEYKSKLRIYVTTFIMFFSIVLILLIFSPVIYKYFFTPKEEQKTEEVQDETSSTQQDNSTQNTNQASVNSLDNQAPSNTQQNTSGQNTTQEQPKQEVTPGVTEQPKKEEPKNEQPKQDQPKQIEPKKVEPKKEQPVQQNNTQSVPGVTKSSMGWIDEGNKVIYIQLDNGKFTIQESAWDSDAKANKRLSSVGAIVPGLKGNVIKVDLGSKGTWYRARFGEFTTIEEAQKKAGELRSKEKNRLQALLLTFLLYT